MLVQSHPIPLLLTPIPAMLVISGLLCTFLTVNATSGPLPVSLLSGNDCTKAQHDSASFLFVVSTRTGQPEANVTIMLNYLSMATNSSGMVTFPTMNVTDFRVGLGGVTVPEPPSLVATPTLCLGSSYYRIVSLQVSRGNLTE